MTTRVIGSVAPKATEVFLTSGTSVEDALSSSTSTSIDSVSEGFYNITGVADTLYNVISWHPSVSTNTDPKGGGVFVFKADVPKTEHNGGTVISPTVPPVSAGSVADFLSGSGETDGSVTGCFVRKDAEVIATTFFGAKEDGTDDYASVQKAVDVAIANGKSIVIPGASSVSDKVIVNLNTTATPISNARPSIFGFGQGVSGLIGTTDNITVLEVVGDLSGSAGAHGYFSIDNMFIASTAPNARTVTGLSLKGLAFISLDDVGFHNLDVCSSNVSVLSSSFNKCVFNESSKGVVSDKDTGFSGFNGVSFEQCEFRQLTKFAYDGFTDSTNLSFNSCQIEGNGTDGDLTTGAINVRASELAGGHTLTMTNCYIEGNGGGFDVQITNNGESGYISALIQGCSIQRTNASKYVINNIKTSGQVILSEVGNNYASYNNYVVTSAEPYHLLSSSTRHFAVGNRYEDGGQVAPEGAASASYPGSVEPAGTNYLPKGWSMSVVSSGVVRITHNLQNNRYAVVATSNDDTALNVRVVRITKSTNTFDVTLRDENEVLTTAPFSFTVTETKQTN